ncbi:hypothetical protein GCM10023186_06210 [Hymenobacter koreensis]|uniref:Uncharacterized protein n=2 Tax=Hymenobacter koreensis TaxID=1084523 RepID=A0ABP8IUV5_9BACT
MMALGNRAAAQALPADSSLLAEAVQYVRQHYSGKLGASIALYNGPQYLSYVPPTNPTHPFFIDAKEVMGNVEYDGYYFADVPLLYDIRYDVLVTSNYGDATKFALVGEKVSRFTINGRHFVRVVVPDTAASNNLRTGFYELLFANNDKLQVLARRTKLSQKIVGREVTRIDFRNVDSYYLLKNGTYHPITSKSSVLAAFGDYRQELKNYIKEHNLKFNSQGRAIAAFHLAVYYTGLAKASAR